MAYAEDPESLIGEVRDRKAREEAEALQGAQRYIETRADESKKAAATRTRLMAVAEYVAWQFVQHDIMPSIRLELERTIEQPRRRWRAATFIEVCDLVAEGWMVGQPMVEREPRSWGEVDPYTGEPPKGTVSYDDAAPRDLFTGRILTPDGGIVRFYRLYKDSASSGGRAVYRGNSNGQFSRFQSFQPEPPLSLEAAQSILARQNSGGDGRLSTGSNTPELPDPIVQTAISELFVNLLPER